MFVVRMILPLVVGLLIGALGMRIFDGHALIGTPTEIGKSNNLPLATADENLQAAPQPYSTLSGYGPELELPLSETANSDNKSGNH